MASPNEYRSYPDAGQAHATESGRVNKYSDSKKRVRNWVFTYNNYWELPESMDRKDIKYMIFGREIGKEGTKHCQGYIQFKKAMTFGMVKKMFGDKTVHIEPAGKVALANIRYCSKQEGPNDGGVVEYGECKRTNSKIATDREAAKREAIEKVADEIKDTITEYVEAGKSLDDWIMDNTVIYSQMRIISEKIWGIVSKRYNNQKLKEWADSITLNEYQLEIEKRLSTQTDRGVLWCYDQVGNKGKTLYTKYKVARGGAIRFTNAKTADIAHAYNGEKLVIFDLSRSVDGRVNYGVIEDLKNGMLFSGKYNSSAKVYVEAPKICIMANFYPDRTQMSDDRWDIYDMDVHVQRAQESLQSVHEEESVQEICIRNGGGHVKEVEQNNVVPEKWYEPYYEEECKMDEISKEELDPGPTVGNFKINSQDEIEFDVEKLFKNEID